MMLSFLLPLLAIVLSGSTARAWLYTLPQGACSSSGLDACQKCVVEFASDNGLRRPCTWCPATASCQMMNQYSGHCSSGDTHRDTCYILADELPRCVLLRYSFWICAKARPRSREQCDADFVDGFCALREGNREVQLCNGDSLSLETVQTVGFGLQNAFSAHKNGYGLELNLNYFWLDAGHGEDRRRIETTAPASEDKASDSWLCNAQIDPDQAIVMKYRVYQTAGSTSTTTTTETAGGSSSSLRFSPFILFSLAFLVVFGLSLQWPLKII